MEDGLTGFLVPAAFGGIAYMEVAFGARHFGQANHPAELGDALAWHGTVILGDQVAFQVI